MDYANGADDTEIRAHHLWQAEQINKDIGLEDLTTAELVAYVAVLAAAHSRFLTGRSALEKGTPRLRLIRDA